MKQEKVWDEFKTKPKLKKSEEEIINDLITLLEKAVKKSLPKEKIGLLLSGGLDSSLLALLLKKSNIDFICYVVEFEHPNFKKADDIKHAKLLAKELKLSLKIVKVKIKEVEKELLKIIKIIKRNEAPMVSIATAIYFCIKQANSEKIKTVFYDCSLDCIFAGLNKHKISKNINKTCVQSLKSTFKTDFPRDTAIANHFKINLRVPFLDKQLISFALKLPKKYKIHNEINKYILRKTAIKLGLPKSIALRKKRSIQYSSNSQKMIKKLAKKNGFGKISDYLKSLNPT